VNHPLALVQSCAQDVPAYRDFLQQRSIDPTAIRTLEDFRSLPTTSKENYHRAYVLPDLCRGGRLPAGHHLAVSSGSTGEPCIWPRRLEDEVGTTERFEQVLVDTFAADQKATLCVVCFALGNWVGGMYTTAACRRLAERGLSLTLATPGNNVAEIVRVVKAVGAHFEQVVLLGYPPFLRDVLDAGTAGGVDWPRLATKLVCAGEVFDEGWRSRVCELMGSSDPARSVASLYGTADGGVLANETAASVRIRRALASRSDLVKGLFGQARLPTLAQFAPEHRYLESVDGRIVISGDGLLPLVRYDILDQGGIVSADAMEAFLRQHGLVDLAQELASGMAGGGGREGASAQPFVYVFGRSGSAVSFYGANVYPENVAPALHRAEFGGKVSGKFVLEVTTDGDAGSRLRVTVELTRGTLPSGELLRGLIDSIERELTHLNSEYAHYVPAARRAPDVVLRDFADPRDFPPGAKHRYTRS